MAIVILWDAKDSWLPDYAERLARELGVKTEKTRIVRKHTGFGISDGSELTRAFLDLREYGVLIDRMIVVTHGKPGSITFGSTHVFAQGIIEYLGNRGFEKLLNPGARIEFQGCNLADINEGCYLGECGMSEHGLVFLNTVSRTLISKGGRVSAWDSKGYSFHIIGTGDHHFSGSQHHILSKDGTQETRHAIGNEMTSPIGMWTVEVNKSTYHYQFYDTHTVQFNEYGGGAEGQGVWSWYNGGLSIRWSIGDRRWSGPHGELDEKEFWDLPLFSKYQTGKAAGNRGDQFSVAATRTEYAGMWKLMYH